MSGNGATYLIVCHRYHEMMQRVEFATDAESHAACWICGPAAYVERRALDRQERVLRKERPTDRHRTASPRESSLSAHSRRILHSKLQRLQGASDHLPCASFSRRVQPSNETVDSRDQTAPPASNARLAVKVVV